MTSVDPTAPLFTVESLRYEDHGDTDANDLQNRLTALAESTDVWVGQGVPMIPWTEPWEFCWVLRRNSRSHADGISLRLGLCREEGGPWQERGLYVGVFFTGKYDLRLFSTRDQDFADRVRAILRMASAGILPPPGPDWCLLNDQVGGERLDTQWVRPATVTGDVNPLDHFWELRDLVREQLHDLDASLPAATALLYFFPAEDILSLNLQEVVEHIAPAFVFSRMVMEEMCRLPNEVHSWLTAYRRDGQNLLLQIKDPPGPFTIEGMDPVTELEWKMMMVFTEMVDEDRAAAWTEVICASLLDLRQDERMGLAGVNELAEASSEKRRAN